jgi:hypothetical protein
MTATDLTPGVLDLTLYRGDDTTFQLDIKDKEDGTPIALPTTGWRGQIRTTRETDDIVGTITITATDAADGVVLLAFPTDLVPGRYVYDVECLDTALTYVQGKIRVAWDVTRDN